MAVIFPQQPLARRDPAAIVTADYEWLRVPHDPADVRAAIEALAVRFGLRFVRGDRWDFASTDPAVDGTVVVRPDDPGFASIGLRIAPSAHPGAGGWHTPPPAEIWAWVRKVLSACQCGFSNCGMVPSSRTLVTW
jgi:hypothetical protein